ncbi:glycosyltransferase family 90 protein [Periconia macrospinosa]|uniref:Glycosyltransferase family 90 protein n=1 Tax=Periconia macrospinosa TaxID=97972 RepID=A0A2V1EC26_9PLEO|nr:glycosyltransferase family 90 protein [Periconia macrospinosa]
MSILMAKPSWHALRVMAFTSILLCGGIWYTWGNVMTRLRFSGNSTGSGFGHYGTNPTSENSAEQFDQGERHPVERLMDHAQKHFEALMNDEAHTLADAAKNYRKRRGRHPPPGFDAWFSFAQTHNALVVEPFFDQIDADLAPLRAIEPHNLRQTAHAFSPKITIRNGSIAAKREFLHEKLVQTASMLRVLAEQQDVRLPDLDIPINVNDEPAMIVPWETIDTALQFVKPMLTPYHETVNDFGTIEDGKMTVSQFDPEWLHGRERHTSAQWLGPRPFWSLVRPACPPGSPTRDQPLMQDIWHREGHAKEEHLASALLPMEFPTGSYDGFVQNSTSALNVCQHPSWQGLHGAFVAPAKFSVTQKLFPLFSTSKLAVSNEILIPSVGDWNISNQPSSMTVPWNEREDKLHWRGPATGGKNTASNWQRFHRHRFVAMLNATHVEIAEGLVHAGNESIIGLGYAKNFRLLPANAYNLETQRGAKMAEWVNSWGDAAFTDLQCSESGGNGTCPYTNEYYSVRSEILPPSDNKTVKYKYAAILDGDGADENGRLVSALRSGILTLKSIDDGAAVD